MKPIPFIFGLITAAIIALCSMLAWGQSSLVPNGWIERNGTWVKEDSKPESIKPFCVSGQTWAKVWLNNAEVFIHQVGMEKEAFIIGAGNVGKVLWEKTYFVYEISINGEKVAEHKVLIEVREVK